MRLLLDENVPHLLRRQLKDHDVDTVSMLRLQAKADHDILSIANAGYDVFITADKNIPFQQNLSRLDVRILILPSNRINDILERWPDISAAISTSAKLVFIQPQRGC
jgi:predicted nuclease of predicted toxin-antitoxin system